MVSRTLGSTASAPGISSHRHRLLLLHHILEERDGTGDLPAIDCLGGFAGVLEGGAEVGATSAGGFGGLEVGGCVSNLVRGNMSVTQPPMD